MSTQDIFAELLAAESITLQGDPANLRSLYIMLYRKFTSYKIAMDNAGYLRPEWLDATVGMSTAASDTIATFTIKPKRKRASFTIVAIGGTPVGAENRGNKNVPANLEYDQDGTLQYRSTNPSSQEHGEDADPSSSQGESTGVWSDEEDWGAHVRAFIESNSDGS